ncbi:MAG: hypothetical protein ACJ79S_10510 [Gemmatimonadaceae bacterium]
MRRSALCIILCAAAAAPEYPATAQSGAGPPAGAVRDDCTLPRLTAQTDPDTALRRRLCTGLRDGLIAANREPRLQSVLRSPANALQLSGATDTKNKTVQAQLGWLGSGLAGATAGFSVSVQGPLDEGEDETRLADLTGLSNVTTAAFNVSWFRWTPNVDLRALRAACAKIRADHEEELKEYPPGDITWCFAGSRRVPQSDWSGLDTAIVYVGRPLTLAASVKIGRQRFKFADATTLGDSSADRTPWSVGGAGGVYFPRLALLVSPSFEYARSSKARRSAQLCRPLDTAGALECRTTPLGAPEEKERQVAGLDLRRFFSPTLGVALESRYDFRDRITAIEVPVYFLRDKAGLNGGVSAGWSSDEHTLSLSAFIGAMGGPTVGAP